MNLFKCQTERTWVQEKKVYKSVLHQNRKALRTSCFLLTLRGCHSVWTRTLIWHQFYIGCPYGDSFVNYLSLGPAVDVDQLVTPMKMDLCVSTTEPLFQAFLSKVFINIDFEDNQLKLMLVKAYMLVVVQVLGSKHQTAPCQVKLPGIQKVEIGSTVTNLQNSFTMNQLISHNIKQKV